MQVKLCTYLLKLNTKMKIRLLKKNCIYSGELSGTVCHFHPNCAIFHLLSLFSLARAISSTCSYELLFLRFLMSVGHNKRWLEHIIHYFVSQLQRCFRKKKMLSQNFLLVLNDFRYCDEAPKTNINHIS